MSTPNALSVFASSTYATALAQWRRSRRPEERALAINLYCEHRVCPTQEEEFRRFFRPPRDPRAHGRALKIALDEYLKKVVRRERELPARRLGVNLVADYSSGKCSSGFEINTQFVNVLNLSGLESVLSIARDSSRKRWEPLRDIPIPDVTQQPSPYEVWLNRNLEGKSPESDEVKSFVSAVFSVLRYSWATGGPFNPTWATTWDRFEPYVKAFKAGGGLAVDRWNQVVGVGTTGHQWQLVLKYPARKVGMIFRPTQLDGGFYAYHFPSPVTAGIGVGGHPMDLSGSAPTQVLLPEYIHEQIEPDIRYWVSAGRLLGRTVGTNYPLTRLRRRHYEKLKGQYRGVAEWMPSPV